MERESTPEVLSYWAKLERYDARRPSNPFKGVCCGEALELQGFPCVCAYVTECPEHGERHWGSHE